MGVYTYLTNPLLTGGTIRLPLKDLVGMRSRPYAERESWFPCKEGDWLLVNGTAWRQVKLQTPQHMTLTNFDMEETMPTSSFLSLKTFNLSATPFWLGITVYIAYNHRYQLDEITKNMTETLEEEIKKIYGENLIAPWVELVELADSSMGFWVWVQMKPEAASQYGLIKNVHITQAALKAANKYGWEIIRFTNVNLHQSDNTKGLLENRNSEE